MAILLGGRRDVAAGSSFAGVIFAAICSSAQMPPISEQARAGIARTLGAKGVYVSEESAYKFTFPRTDVTIRVSLQRLSPNQAPKSWATFSPSLHREAVLNGELMVFEDEVNPVITVALKSGLQVTGLGQTLLFDQPRLLSLDITAEGAYQTLAAALRKALDEVRRVRTERRNPLVGAGPIEAAVHNAIDPFPLRAAAFFLFGQPERQRLDCSSSSMAYALARGRPCCLNSGLDRRSSGDVFPNTARHDSQTMSMLQTRVRGLSFVVCAYASAALAQVRPGPPPATALSPSPPSLSGQGAPANSQGTPDNGGRPTISAVRLAQGESITLDGRLDERFWSRAVPAADFIQIDPANGSPATERTEVRIVFNRDALYLGITCFDSEPDRWIGWQLQRDERLFSDDGFMWTIDTFLDGRTGYLFEMNPSGLMADALIGLNGENREWDGIWNARVQRTDIGWTLEIEIPFRTLNFNPDNDAWGINFQRVVRRKNEQSIWTGWARNQGLQRMTNAGLLTDIRDVTQGHGLDIKPYGLVSSLASPGRGKPEMTIDASAGLDLFYNPTPLLRTNLTVNTDFAQTEVDQRQVNLTRYSLFFPEQRDFFLDGATFFDFASDSGGGGNMFGPVERGNEERLIPFFSRRLGLSADGTPQKIDFGTKVTGQAGAQDVGLLHVRTGEDAGFNSEDFTVARIKRRVLRQSYVGGLYTRRDQRLGDVGATHMVGLDGRLATSTFLRDQNLEANGWFLFNSRPGSSDGNGAFGASLLYPNDLWNARIDATEVQENFDSAIGFVSRRAYRQYSQAMEFGPRPANHRYIRQVTIAGRLDTLTDLHNDLLKRNIIVQPAQVQFHSQDNFRLTFFRRYERLDTPFALTPKITLPLGAAYTFHRYRLFVSTANRRRLAVNSSIEVGQFYSGTRAEQQVGVAIRVRPGLFFFLTGQWNDVKLPEGHFTTRLYRIVGETHFSPFIALTNNIQYDSQSSILGWQSRFRWIITPGNDLYVVYTHNWLDERLLDRFSTLDNRLASKVLYTYRF